MSIARIARGANPRNVEKLRALIRTLEEKSNTPVQREFFDDGRTKLIFDYSNVENSAVMLSPDASVKWAVIRTDPPGNELRALGKDTLSRPADAAVSSLADTAGISAQSNRGHMGRKYTPHATFENVDPENLSRFINEFDTRMEQQWARELANNGVLQTRQLLAEAAEKAREYPSMYRDVDGDLSRFIDNTAESASTTARETQQAAAATPTPRSRTLATGTAVSGVAIVLLYLAAREGAISW